MRNAHTSRRLCTWFDWRLSILLAALLVAVPAVAEWSAEELEWINAVMAAQKANMERIVTWEGMATVVTYTRDTGKTGDQGDWGDDDEDNAAAGEAQPDKPETYDRVWRHTGQAEFVVDASRGCKRWSHKTVEIVKGNGENLSPDTQAMRQSPPRDQMIRPDGFFLSSGNTHYTSSGVEIPLRTLIILPAEEAGGHFHPYADNKGGTHACEMLRRLSPELAGAVVWSAGCDPAADWPDLTGKAVYVGCGEKDHEFLPAAEAAASHLATRGASVTFEQWTGFGHAIADARRLHGQTVGGMKVLREWLLAQAETPSATAVEAPPTNPVDATTSRPEDWMDNNKPWQPGNVFDIQDSDAGEDGFFRVYVPEEYNPVKAWPVIFYYPGLTEKPSTAVIRHATDAKRYIVVGMSYSKPEPDGSKPFAGEVRVFHHVLTRLKEHLNVDEARLYVSGFSKGGFYACEFMRLLSPELAGAIVLGMGTDGGSHAWPDLTGKHIFIGVGEKDFYRDDETEPHFTRLGATVTHELWPGIEHAVGDLTGLRHWLIKRAATTEPTNNQPNNQPTVHPSTTAESAESATEPHQSTQPADSEAATETTQPEETHYGEWALVALWVLTIWLLTRRKIKRLANRRTGARHGL